MSRTIRITISGDPKWSKHISNLLRETYPDCQVHNTDPQIRNLSSIINYFMHIIKSKIILRIGRPYGIYKFSNIAMDIPLLFAAFLGKRVLNYWIGSEAYNFDNYKNKNRLFLKNRKIRHIVGSKKIKMILSKENVESRLFYMPSITQLNENEIPLPNNFTIMTYIPFDRFSFYGGLQIVEIAQENPTYKFIFVGISASEFLSLYKHLLPNIEFVKFTNDMSKLYSKSSIVIRLVETDALGGSAIEGLSFGRHVIYSWKNELIDYVDYVDFHDSHKLRNIIYEYWIKHENYELKFNHRGQDYVIGLFSQKATIGPLLAYIIGVGEYE